MRLAPAAERAPAEPKQGAEPMLGFAGARVLIAEDNPTNQTVLRLRPQKGGCAAPISRDGVAEVRAHSPQDMT
ncbi:MAG TPA: hypothetical protein VKB88_35815 [Bryobacteraceae bacterium]|nr:hypothetical protein [Bryobacteraceae bacterium]